MQKVKFGLPFKSIGLNRVHELTLGLEDRTAFSYLSLHIQVTVALPQGCHGKLPIFKLVYLWSLSILPLMKHVFLSNAPLHLDIFIVATLSPASVSSASRRA